jgi:hypothetical protein
MYVQSAKHSNLPRNRAENSLCARASPGNLHVFISVHAMLAVRAYPTFFLIFPCAAHMASDPAKRLEYLSAMLKFGASIT